MEEDEGFSEEVRRRVRRRTFRAAVLVALAAIEFAAIAISPDLAASVIEECGGW